MRRELAGLAVILPRDPVCSLGPAGRYAASRADRTRRPDDTARTKPALDHRHRQRFDESRLAIQPSLGASTYDFTPSTIATVPLGEQAPLNQVLLRAPGVVQDSFGQIHVRGDHGNLQYRLDGVQLPEGLSLFTMRWRHNTPPRWR